MIRHWLIRWRLARRRRRLVHRIEASGYCRELLAMAAARYNRATFPTPESARAAMLEHEETCPGCRAWRRAVDDLRTLDGSTGEAA